MTVVRRFYPEVRLKKLLSSNGGIRTDEALLRAGRNLDEIREACLSGVDTKIERLVALSAIGGQEASDECYEAANEIFAEAGVFGLNELSAVAHSLCALLSVAERAKVPAAAIKVHADAMRALRTPSIAQNEKVRQAVLSELQVLAQRFTSSSAA
ncbi:MAG: hypothetical protein ABL889_07545 [Terricaulis sp.]